MKQIRILIVEDEALVALDLSMELEAAGYIVTGFVASGEDAVEKARTDEPDLILMDISLNGEMDGIDAAARILEFKKIPILFMTGYSRRDFANRVDKLAPLGFLNKPVEVESVKHHIEDYFGKQK